MTEACVVKGHPHPGRCMSEAEYRAIPQDELMEWAKTVPPGCYEQEPIEKPGPTVTLTPEMLTIDHFLASPTRVWKQLQETIIGKFLTGIFGNPWDRPDTWRGWPTEFVLFPRLDRLQHLNDRATEVVNEYLQRVNHSLAAVAGRDDRCPTGDYDDDY